MLSESDAAEWNDSSGEEYSETIQHRRKRRKLSRNAHTTKTSTGPSPEPSEAAFSPFDKLINSLGEESDSFEQFIEPLMPELLEAAAIAQVEKLEYDAESGQQSIPMSRLQAKLVLEGIPSSSNPTHSLIARKLKLHPSSLRASVLGSNQRSSHKDKHPLSPLVMPRKSIANAQVIDALYAIQTTPYASSFLSRVQGFQPKHKPNMLSINWEDRAPWMDLMCDIREHFALMHPNREQPTETEAPIEYSTLRASHLDQVHEILSRAFWSGIDVSDSLQYSPERCTVIATYKNMVVGAAFLSSPQETYITYLAVKPGWDNAQIATSMLYHLITLNPNRDITLHVSINNPAVLLYNRFGFKAEEFIVGFYEDYLDPQSRASKNAFRLRLRR